MWGGVQDDVKNNAASINALQENLKSETAKLDSLISSLGNVN